MGLSPAVLESTHRKLTIRVSLTISAVIHGFVLLWVRLDLPEASVPIAKPTIEVTLIATPPDEELTYEEEPDPELVSPAVAPENQQGPRDIPKLPEHSDGPFVNEPADAESTESSDTIDWEDIISTFAEEATIQNIEQERHHAAMWKKTHSVMFTPPEDWLIEDKPYLPDLQFEADKPKRLGIKISDNCYLGFPGIDPQTVDSDAPGWSGGGSLQPIVKLFTCGFGD